MRKSTWILSGTAVVLVAASAVTRFAVYPEVHQLPSDTDSVFAYTGTASLLNAAALEQGYVANAFLSDIPVTVERHVKVVDTDGGTAKAIAETAKFLKEQGKVETVLADYSPYVSAKFISD